MLTGRRLSPQLADGFIGAAIVMWMAAPPVEQLWQPTVRASALLKVALIIGAAVQGLAFRWRRIYPVPLVVLSLCVYGVEHGTVSAPGAGVAVLVASYGLGFYGKPRLRRFASAVAEVVLAISLVVALGFTRSDHSAVALSLALAGGTLLFGQVQAARTEAVAGAVAAARDAERSRLARELHDVLVHQLSAIAVQAGAARIAGYDHHPRALLVVEDQARQALSELDHLLGVLRRPGDDTAVRTPAPTLSGLPHLITHAIDAGVPASLNISGPPRPLPAAVELSGYRIVQEALTNVVAHAPGARTDVELCYAADHLAITIRNSAGDTPVATTRRGGHGLVGMYERVTMLGGTLTAAPPPGGGFCVTAELPYGETTAAGDAR
jgi:signal transduction histidine kinase